MISDETANGLPGGTTTGGGGGGAAGGRPTVGMVIPFHGRPGLLDRCLDAVARLRPPPAEVLVVSDGDRVDLEHRGLVRVLASGGSRGPAAARNLGAAALTTDIVLFVDADVLVPPDTVERIQQTFVELPEVVAVFGSYDDRPEAPGLVSRYKNLLHHWTHQHARTEATTFWTGCGAVRRSVFLEAGGFDPDQRWLEDVELGYRLRAARRPVMLDRDLQVTHLKRWSLVGLVMSDVFHRALPWTELASRYRSLPLDLNTDRRGRASGALAVIAAGSMAAALASPWLLVPTAASLGALVALNLRLYRFFGRHGGVPLLVVGAVLHWSYLLYGSAAYGLGRLWWLMAGTRRPTVRPPLPGLGGLAQGPVSAVVEPAASSRPRATKRSA